MKTRILGKNGPELTVLGFGAWAIGGPWQWGWGKVDDNESVRSIQTAIDGGINWIDTAAVYGFGHSEQIVAKAIKGKRDKVFIATKCGLLNDGNGNALFNLKPKSIRAELEASLKYLETDYVDLYQIHWPNLDEDIEAAWHEMSKFKKEGKTRFIGVSNFNVNQMERCMQIEPIQSLQPPYSFIRREVEESVLPFCEKNGIGVIAYSPMGAGLFTGKFDISKVAADDWRQSSPYFKEPILSKSLLLAEKLKSISGKFGKSVGHIALAWVIKNSALTSAIVGARTVEQSKENILFGDFELDDDTYEQINKLIKEVGL